MSKSCEELAMELVLSSVSTCEANQRKMSHGDASDAKESTEVDENREILGMHSLKSWDGIIHKPHGDLKKYKGSQQEWHMKKLQAEDEMQSWDLHSFSNSVGHFSSLEVNKSGSCNLNDGLNKCSSSHISQPDISSCSQLHASQHENTV